MNFLSCFILNKGLPAKKTQEKMQCCKMTVTEIIYTAAIVTTLTKITAVMQYTEKITNTIFVVNRE